MFDIGDIVTGKEFCGYRVTNEHSKCLVEGISGNRMKVRLIETQQKCNNEGIGDIFHVDVEDFLLFKKANIKEEVW